MKLLIFMALMAMCFLAGCTKYWYQEGKTFAECSHELRECRYELLKYRDNTQYTLGAYEESFIKDCMKTRGYKLVTEGSLPNRARRQGPNTLKKEKYGVAGILEK